jgi:hypothetical protein
MRALPDCYTLCQLFPKPFRVRNNLTSEIVLKLVRKIQDGVHFVHSKDILIVDLNEFNFMVTKKFDEVNFIDVDSYQTKSFAATALMETVRDRHATRFSRDSDWFSFAIVSFQMFRGIHPYKGKHSKYTSLDERMLHNISVLNPQVTYPAGAVLPEDVVPQTYRDWFKEVLEKGRRLPPPNDITNIINVIVPTVKILKGKLFSVSEYGISRENIVGDILEFHRSGNETVIVTNQKIYTSKGFQCDTKGAADTIGFTSKKNIPVRAYIDSGGFLALTALNNYTQCGTFNLIKAEALTSAEGTIYYKYQGNIFKLDLFESQDGSIRGIGHTAAQVMERATQLFPGCAIQNMLGSFYIHIFPANAQLRLRELDGHKVIEAKYENGILMVIATKGTKYFRFVFKVDLTSFTYSVRVVEDIQNTGLNFIVLPNGICVSIVEDGSFELFHNNINKNDIKQLKDDEVSNIHLLRDGTAVLYGEAGRLYKLTMI